MSPKKDIPTTPPTLIRLDKFDPSQFERGTSRIIEFLWQLTKAIFFLTPFPFPSSLRTHFLKLFKAKIGKNVVIRSGVNIHMPWRLKIGDHAWIGEGVQLLTLSDIHIGSHVCISQKAFLCTGSHQFNKESFDLIVRSIHIEDHSWVGATAFIAPGIRIGQGAFVHAGSVLLQNVPAYHFAKGNPAQIKPR